LAIFDSNDPGNRRDRAKPPAAIRIFPRPRKGGRAENHCFSREKSHYTIENRCFPAKFRPARLEMVSSRTSL
jgi:hypothetical protein